jgi:RNA polymerase sigma-70 factor (ECF subfamily)
VNFPYRASNSFQKIRVISSIYASHGILLRIDNRVHAQTYYMLESLQTKKKLQTYAQRMKAGDAVAAAGVYELLVRQTYGFYFSRVRSKERAEDLTQDVFTRLVRAIQQYDETKGDFTVWYWKMARNMLIDHFRKESRSTTQNLDELPEAADPVADEEMEENLDKKRNRAKLESCLAQLNEEERHLFELRYLSELSYAEMAGILEKNEGALRVAVNRLKNKLESMIKSYPS